MNCFRCKKKRRLSDTDNKTCESCINYIGEQICCAWCNGEYTRTNRNRHMRSFRCISRHGELALYYKNV